jgi:sugar lactone lactonase YvrE
MVMSRVKLALVGLLLLAFILAAPGLAAAANPAQPFPAIIALPDGWQPEGIVSGYGTTLYAGSLATGAIYQADARTGEGFVVVPAQGRPAVGLDFDERTGYLFVAGGPSGTGTVYDTRTGAAVAMFQFATSATFVNDVIVTPDAAYFTDSMRGVLYAVPLSPSGQPAATFTAISLGPDFAAQAGVFKANGIVATPSGDALIVVNSSLGRLYRVDPDTGAVMAIDLGGATLPAGDGLLLHGQTLYVVQNRLNQIAVVTLDPDLTSGAVVDTITHPAFAVPTTVTRLGSWLYAVNARFGTPPTPTTPYSIVQVTR